jgi:ribosomal protein S11
MKKRLNFRERYLMSKKNPDNKKYYAFFLKKKNNVFVTITDIRGKVITSQSAGSCKITTKKKKKSWDTLKAVASSASKIARLKNIRYIYKFFMTSTYMKNCRIIFQSFKESGLLILQNIIIRSRPHALPMRKKKLKRL